MQTQTQTQVANECDDDNIVNLKQECLYYKLYIYNNVDMSWNIFKHVIYVYTNPKISIIGNNIKSWNLI